MKLLIFLFILCFLFASARAQQVDIGLTPIKKASPWRIDGNKILTGSLVFLAGASKGFNETLLFHYKGFQARFPNANAQWFNPELSWTNKYRDCDPGSGAKFPLSTTLFVATTDQYHLNNFINKTAWMSTILIKMSEGRKSFKNYFLDMLYYTACHQLGFAMMYYPFKTPKHK